jgi:hypothetical protein
MHFMHTPHRRQAFFVLSVQRSGLCRVALAGRDTLMLARRARRRNSMMLAARHDGTNPWLDATDCMMYTTIGYSRMDR